MSNPKNFALIGVGGYVAPRHLKAIKDTGNVLVAAMDPNDSVGIIDSYFSSASFFTEFERFDRHAEKLRRQGEESRIQYVSICSPNYLHDAHIRFALRIGAVAVCEKPLVLNPWNLDALAELEQETGQRVYTVLQLRQNQALADLKKQMEQAKPAGRRKVVLTYITPRGKWYNISWKGQGEKSGGIATNIGIHLFDLLIWLFGRVERSELHCLTPQRASGFLEMERAEVKWYLSLDRADLPEGQGARSYRLLEIDGQAVDFTEGFTDLHTMVYQEILAGRGLGIAEARLSLELTHAIRDGQVVVAKGNAHPRLR